MYARLIVAALAVASVSAHWAPSTGRSLVARGTDEVWGGFNLTQAALQIQASISSPTCNATESCIAFNTTVVPQCLRLQGSAGCWCTLHDPLHYCALCMSNPTDNTTTATQTQSAGDGHSSYHKGCGAYMQYLSQGPPSSTSAAAVATASAASSNSSSSSMSTGALVGIIIGGVIGVVLIVAATFLIYRKMKNSAVPVNSGAGGHHNGIDPYGGPGEVKTPYGMGPTPPPPPFVSYSHQPSHTPQPMTPMGTDYNPRESTFAGSNYGPVPTTAHSDTMSNGGSQHGGPGGFHSPPPPFVSNPGAGGGYQPDYDTSMLGNMSREKYGRAAEPM